ncbi:hypothetical protein KDD93_05005 [Campylobacter sp. faydin G-24]|uniref:Uncharacterized protein n=1 Tax=Campylobacter anatolicus TaxID=2829105 RepID=A0ABS5HIH6_9BACT|nr:hypothetical protein [Campylobacter anatolicus]MBR8462859.1 hypothetical protein [Campylobacter anatolicus]MBR8463933.1 hypothetical protein [Campylobacter anatolicus]MBR8465881.1 hypothetical protein [Campylobacter anatolicus]
MDYELLKKQIERIKDDLSIYDNVNIDEIKPSTDPIEFNKTAEILRQKVQKARREGDFFKNTFNNDEYYENISSYLNQTKMSIYHKIEKEGVSLEANKNLHQSIEMIENIIEILVVEYQFLTKKDKNSIFSTNSSQRVKIRTLLNELVAIKNRVQKIIHFDSKIVANVILKEFKMIFTFFSNCIIVAKSRQDELLLVEIAGITDKIMSMIIPVFSNKKSLKVNELIYHYLIYELREIKANAIGERLA